MSRNTLHFWIDLVSFLVMMGLVLTGGIMHFTMPPGTGHTHTLFGLDRHDYGTIHFYLALTAVSLVAVHVYLHWAWVCSVVGKAVTGGQPGLTSRCIAGAVLVVVLGVLVVAGIWWAGGHVKETAKEPGGGRGRSGLHTDEQPADAPVIAEENEAVDSGGLHEAGHEHQPKNKNKSKKDHGDCPAAAPICGQTSLLEAAQAANLSVPDMCRHLGVAEGENPGGKLGRLRQQYGFSMNDVRVLVCQGQ